MRGNRSVVVRLLEHSVAENEEDKQQESEYKHG
mgnify:CR=1 FL=1